MQLAATHCYLNEVFGGICFVFKERGAGNFLDSYLILNIWKVNAWFHVLINKNKKHTGKKCPCHKKAIFFTFFSLACAGEVMRLHCWMDNKKQCGCVWCPFQTEQSSSRHMLMHNLQLPPPQNSKLEGQQTSVSADTEALGSPHKGSAAERLGVSWRCHNLSSVLLRPCIVPQSVV